MTVKEGNETHVCAVSPTAMRIAASIGCVPFVIGIDRVCTGFFLDVLGTADQSTTAPLYVSAVIAVSLWLLIWHGVVVFSRGVVVKTIFITVLCLGLPLLLHRTLSQWSSTYAISDSVLAALPIIGWGCWMAWTIRIWPVRADAGRDVLATPRCMSCGYLLTGLKSTRCPECGDAPTLDELWSATRDGV